MALIETAFNTGNFSQIAHKLVDEIASYLNDATKPAQKTLNYIAPEEHYKYWSEHFLKQQHQDPIELFTDVMNSSINIHSKKYLGHQVAVTPPITGLSSMLISILNNGMGVYEMGMVGNCLEKVLINNLINKLGFGGNASGFITSGGTIGNLTALLAARGARTDVWNTGNNNRKWAILISEQAHYSIDRAVKIMGLGSEGIIKIPVNPDFTINIEALKNIYREQKNKGIEILCCVGCSCTTATGSFDQLDLIGDFCAEFNIWFHVDAAHGGAAIYSAKHAHLLSGIEKADSVIIDYHKMMLTPSLSTAVLFRNGKDSFQAFSQKAEYLFNQHDQQDWYNSATRTFECTKSMSVLNIYTLFSVYGEKIFEENIDILFALTSSFAKLIRANNDFELAAEPKGNIVCFRYLKENTDLDNLNVNIRQQLIQEGDFYITQATLNGQVFLRLSIMNPLTTVAELELLINTICRIARQ